MTASEILEKLGRYNNIDIDEELGLDWLNLFQQDVAFDGGPISNYDFTPVEGGTFYNLPSDFISFIKAMDSMGQLIKLEDVTIDRSSILFSSDADSVSMSYVRVPPTLISASEQLSVHPRFQEIAYLYLIYMYYDMEGEGDPEESSFAQRYFERYEFKKNQIASELLMATTDPVKTHDVLPRRSGKARLESEFY
jgi:hypothetical protein